MLILSIVLLTTRMADHKATATAPMAADQQGTAVLPASLDTDIVTMYRACQDRELELDNEIARLKQLQQTLLNYRLDVQRVRMVLELPNLPASSRVEFRAHMAKVLAAKPADCWK